MSAAPAQLGLPGIPLAPEPIESEVAYRLLPIEVTSRGAHLKVVAMWEGIYPNVASACSAAEAMGLTGA